MGECHKSVGSHVHCSRQPDRRNADIAAFVRFSCVTLWGTDCARTVHDHTSGFEHLAYWATALAADLIEIKYNKLASRRWAQFLTQINAYRDSKGEIDDVNILPPRARAVAVGC